MDADTIMMQYRGIGFTIVQAIERGRWKWTIELPPEGAAVVMAKLIPAKAR